MKKNSIIGIVSVLAFTVFLAIGYANANGSFWAGLQDRIARVAVDKLFANAPDLSVENLGASASPDKYNHQRFLANYSVGGGGAYYATSSSVATYTLTTTELPNNRERNYIEWTPNVNVTLTTMASSSAPFQSLKVGESYSMDMYNASSTAGATITFAAGTGIDLQEMEGGSVIVNGLEGATLKFIKKTDTDIMMLVSPWQVGD